MKNPFGIRRLAAGIAVLAAAGLTASAQVVFTGQSQDPEGWKTVWYDHFDGSTLDTNNWNIEQNTDGGGNWELQYYGPEGVTVRDGNLVLTATREARQGKAFTSGRVNSRGKAFFAHGKIEARIKLPKTARGLWPAFWMLGENIGTNPWPQCGEIDILEMGHVDGWAAGNDPERYMNGACHWGYYTGGNYPNYAKAGNAPFSVQDGEYHTFTCEWSSETLAMYVDREINPNPYYEIGIADYADDKATGNYFHKPFHILFNLAVGGRFPNITDPNGITASLPAEMLVDWVRIAQPEGDDFYTFNVPYIDEEDRDEYEPDPDTDPGRWGQLALDENGNSTFDFANADDFVLISTSQGFNDQLTGKNVTDYNVDEVNNFFYIWSDTYNPGASKGVNSFGFAETYTTLEVGTVGWSGAGFASANKGKDLSMLADDDYVLHFSMKGADKSSHRSHTITVGNVAFTIGQPGGETPALGDYPRDGQWYSFDIPLKVLRNLGNPLFTDASNFLSNVVAFSSGSLGGTRLQFDNIFFYRSKKAIVDLPSTDDTTEIGRYASKSIENGQPTFDFANGYDYVPVMTGEYALGQMEGKIRLNLNVGTDKHNFYIWEYTYNGLDATGKNSMNEDANYTALEVSDKKWSGAAVHFDDTNDLSFLVNENYWVHFAMKGDDILMHTPQTLTIGKAKFNIGPSTRGIASLGDYRRDGEWYSFDIPVKDLLVIAAPLCDNIAAFTGDLFTFSSGAAKSGKLTFDNIFFYKNDTKVIEDGKDTTPCGPYMTTALNGGASVFDWTNAEKIIPVHISEGVKALMNGKIREGYDTSVTNPEFQIWEQTYEAGEGSGVNSFGLAEDFTSLVTGTKGWTGGGINITTAADMSVLSTEDNYYLHLAIRDADYLTHQAYGFELNGAKFTLGKNGDGYVTDFTRDGEWHYLDIPVSALKAGLFSSATSFTGNILTFNSGSRTGAKFEIDNVFFYINLDPKEPDQPVKPAVEPKVTLRASSTSPFVGNKVTLTAATTVPADATVTKVEFFEGETSIGTDTEAPYTCEFTPAEARTYSIKAVMTLSDDRTATSAEVKVTARVDNPTVSLAAAPATVTEGETVTLTANVHVPQGAEAAKVEFKVNNQTVSTVTEGDYKFTWTPAGAGEYTLTAVMTLADGRTATSSEVKVTVKEDLPTVTLSADATTVTAGDNINLSADMHLPKDAEVAKVEFKIGDDVVATDTEAPYEYEWNAADAGQYAATAVMTLKDGREIVSAAVTLTVNAKRENKVTRLEITSNTLQADGTYTVVISYDYTTAEGYIVNGVDRHFGLPENATYNNDLDNKTVTLTGLAPNSELELDLGFSFVGREPMDYQHHKLTVTTGEGGSTGPVDPVDPTDGTVINFNADSEGATNLLDGGYIKFSWNAANSILTVTAHFNEVENGQRNPGGVAFVRPGVTGDVNMTSAGNGSYTLDITGLNPGDKVSGYAWYGIDGGRAQSPIIEFTVPTGGDTPDPVEVTYKGYTYTTEVQAHTNYVTVPYRIVKIENGVETTLTQEEANELDLNVYYAWAGNDDYQASIALHNPEGVYYCTGLNPATDYTLYAKFFIHGKHNSGGTHLDNKDIFNVRTLDAGAEEPVSDVYKSLVSGAIKPVDWDNEHADSKGNDSQYITDTDGFGEGFIYWQRLEKGIVSCCSEKQFMNLHMYYWAEQLTDGRLRFTFTYVDVDGHADDDATMGHRHTGLVPAVHFYDELNDGSFQIITPDIDLARFLDEPLRCPDTFDFNEPWTRENGVAPVAPEAVNRAITYKNDAAIEAKMKELGYTTARVETTKPYNETSANIAFNMQFADGGLTLSDVSRLSGIDDSVSTGIFDFGNDLDPEGIYVVNDSVIAPEGSVVFNIHGIPVGGENLAPGIYIVVNGNNACKVLVK